MSENRPYHDDAIVEVLDALAPPAEDSWTRLEQARGPAGASGAGAATERCAYVETFAALAYASEPMAPSPEVKDRLLLRIRGDATQIVAPTELPDRPSSTRIEASEPEPESTAEPVSSRARPRRRGLGLLAAVLAVCALGLGAMSYWLWGEIERTRERLAEQGQALARTTAVVEGLQEERARLAELEARLAAARESLGLVTATTTELCPLYPPEQDPPMPTARGILYIGPDQQRWYLRAVGLRPLRERGERRSYQLWFIPIDGDRESAVSAGTFDVGPDQEIELSSERMPPTRAVLVTIEPQGGAERPSGPTVLYGEETMTVL